MNGYFAQIYVIVWKDLLLEFRTRERMAAMGAFAVAYADQNRKDYKAFARAGKEGRMEVVSGV